MRDKFIVGNWKMYGNKNSVTKLLNDLKAYDKKVISKVKLVVCPPYIFLDQTQFFLQKTAKCCKKVGPISVYLMSELSSTHKHAA